jgi:hypothetical protein
MTDTQKKVASVAVNDKTVRMPPNALKEPQKKFSDTFSFMTVIKQEFSAAK